MGITAVFLETRYSLPAPYHVPTFEAKDTRREARGRKTMKLQQYALMYAADTRHPGRKQ